MDTRSRHLTMDVWLASELSESMVEQLKALIRRQLTVLKEVEHQFTPHGQTVVFILSESHFTIHTYPEEHYVSLDCYVCNPNVDLEALREAILAILDTHEVQTHIHARGHKVRMNANESTSESMHQQRVTRHAK